MQSIKAFITNSRIVWPAALILIAAGCSTLHVRTDYSHTADFGAYHTYSWLKVDAGNDLWANRIRRDVNQALVSHGWMEVPGGGQTSVAAFGATQNERSLETFYSGFGPGFGGWRWGGFGLNEGYAITQPVYTPVGSLTVDIFNSTNHQLIWRSTATRVISGNPVKNERKLKNSVEKMFKTFPPAVA